MFYRFGNYGRHFRTGSIKYYENVDTRTRRRGKFYELLHFDQSKRQV